mmetsp:Transcript_27518/g.69445  ORF Transcript_27518/g.69445 Transcript_27518/m.69445 type:complete len:214 (+) Transcript_27518:378-1019(+)
MENNKINPHGTVVYVSTEGVRGITGMAPKATVPEDPEGLSKVMLGTFIPPKGKKKWDFVEQYNQVKMMGTLWISSFARKNPNLKVFSVSPGMTSGTKFVETTKDSQLQCMPNIVKCVGCCGVSHGIDIGSDRYTRLANHPEQFVSGVFYASAGGGASGPMSDQTPKHSYLSNQGMQDVVYQTIDTAFTKAKGVQGGQPLPEQATMSPVVQVSN